MIRIGYPMVSGGGFIVTIDNFRLFESGSLISNSGSLSCGGDSLFYRATCIRYSTIYQKCILH